MNQQKKIDIVQGMQDYIKKNPSLELEGMYKYIGYSKRHADRIFSELLHTAAQGCNQTKKAECQKESSVS